MIHIKNSQRVTAIGLLPSINLSASVSHLLAHVYLLALTSEGERWDACEKETENGTGPNPNGKRPKKVCEKQSRVSRKWRK